MICLKIIFKTKIDEIYINYYNYLGKNHKYKINIINLFNRNYNNKLIL